jgi:hypothetical protein
MKREESAKIFLRLKEMYHQLNICGFSHASASIVDAIDLRKKEGQKPHKSGCFIKTLRTLFKYNCPACSKQTKRSNE